MVVDPDGVELAAIRELGDLDGLSVVDVDAGKFARVVAAMNDAVGEVESEGLLEHVRSIRRQVVERCEDPAEALEEAAGWSNLRLPAAVARRLREAEERPIEFVDNVRYRLFAIQG